jgi:AcrR family transcriptional regulator
MTYRSGDRRAKIVAAALRLIADEGAAPLTTRKIAREAGVNLGTLHYFFGSKHALLMAVLEEVTSRMIAAVSVPLPRHAGRRAMLAEACAGLWALVDLDPRLPLVRCELALNLRRDREYTEAVSDQRQQYLDALARLYATALGDTPAAISCQMFAELVVSVLDGVAIQSADADARDALGQTGEQALRAVLALVDDGIPTDLRTPTEMPVS